MLSSMSCALVARCTKSLALYFKFKLPHLLMKSVTGSSFLCLAPVSSIILTVLLVLKKGLKNSPSSNVQLSMEAGSTSGSQFHQSVGTWEANSLWTSSAGLCGSCAAGTTPSTEMIGASSMLLIGPCDELEA
ncbi:hypothetical protein LIER_17572 [Lithospermum erythrorhizon]|uniref:Uncharacterized protein n=1 Tax=Lithospermum erythrorhizon TaxID=34254 RepID=A0AAV3QCG7_LITER